MKQAELFSASPSLPPGFDYCSDFLTIDEEADLLAAFAQLPFREAQYKQFTARRRIVSFGGSYDFSANELVPAGPIPGLLQPLRRRISQWAGI
ncbi:MAG TPA: alpha-ketoglutarate-dependent dioxygenase AlkB, partial [Candidatus Binatia bacterium]|nr:alpha-ketoglutarate-dependent dioxygenase AlkB [Candidatus Binatia bacterium]